jgi:hypothetical protein
MGLQAYCAGRSVRQTDPFGEEMMVDVCENKKNGKGVHPFASEPIREFRCHEVEAAMEALMPGADVVIDRDSGLITIVRPPRDPSTTDDPEKKERLEAAQRIYAHYKRIIGNTEHALYVAVDIEAKENGYTPYDEAGSRNPKKGSGGRMVWNPERTPSVERTANGRVVRSSATPEETFHHETNHGAHGMEGTRDPSWTKVDVEGRENPVTIEEARTIGLSHTRPGDSPEHDASEVLGRDPRASHWANWKGGR